MNTWEVNGISETDLKIIIDKTTFVVKVFLFSDKNYILEVLRIG